MATFEEHCQDCEHLLGNRCEEVNRWLDKLFVKFQEKHRFARHHTRGIDEAQTLFGEIGRKAAMIHILKDCGHIPTGQDWAEYRVDGMGRLWSSSFNGTWNPQKFLDAAQKLINQAH